MNQEFEAYLSRNLPQVDRYARRASKVYRPLFQYLIRLYGFGCFLIDDCRILEKPDPSITPLKILMAKATTGVRALTLCLYSGVCSEGALIARSLFEISATTRFILAKDAPERLCLFDNYRHVAVWRHMRAYQGLVQRRERTQADFDALYSPQGVVEVEENYRRVCSEYHPTRPHHWAWRLFLGRLPSGGNPNLRNLCQEIGAEDEYLLTYDLYSVSAHPSPLLDRFYQDAGLVLMIPHYPKMLPGIASLGHRWGTDIIKSIVNYVGPPNAERIAAYLDSTHTQCVRLVGPYMD